MSTTGCRVGTSVVSQPSARSAATASRGPLGGAALALEDVGAHALVDRGQVAVEELLGVVRAGRDPRALAQLQHRLLRRRPVAARRRRRGSSPAPAPARRARERRLDRVRKPRRRPRRAAPRSPRPRTCSSPCGTTSARPRASPTITSSASSASGESAAPVTSHFGPKNASRRLDRQRRRALVRDAHHQVGLRRREHRLERLHRPAARSAPRGTTSRTRRRRRARPPAAAARRGTERSHSGWANTARRVSPGMAFLYSIATRVRLRAPDARERAPRPHRAARRTPSRSPASSCSPPARATSAPRTAASRTSPSTCSSRAPSAGRARAT